jgi:pimeloyl-ACP methyl ester carboxylesterase
MTLVAGTNVIPTAHGTVAVHLWPGDGLPLLAIHGVDGNHDAWGTLAEALDGERPLVALDLRGRGDSSADGPFGVVAHAEDAAEVAERLLGAHGGRPIDVVGHSFGGHVAARLAADRPELVRSLLLVDGGPPRVIPEGMSPADIVAGALANIVPNLGSKPFTVSSAAVEADFASMVIDPAGSGPLADLAAIDRDGGVHILRAESGVAPGLPPVVPDQVIDALETAGLSFTTEVVADTNHFSILDDPALVEAVRRLV